MSTRSGAPYTPRTTRRIQARQQAAARTRSRPASVPSRLPRSRQSADISTETVVPNIPLGSMSLFPGTRAETTAPQGGPVVSQPAPTYTQAQPFLTPSLGNAAPNAALHTTHSTGDYERINARIIRDICVQEDLAREREIKETLYKELDSLRGEIRALKARTDQSDNVIADLQTLRRDVNSLLERSATQALAVGQNQRSPGVEPAHPITIEEASASRPVATTAGQDKSSFSKLSELLARLERLEKSQRDNSDHPNKVGRTSRDQYSRNRRQRRRPDSDSDASSEIEHRRHTGSSSDDTSSEDEDRPRRSKRTPRKGDTFRPKGERYKRLKPLTATDSRFRKVLDYRYYRLDRTSKSRDLGKLRHQVKTMMVTLRRHIFDGRDPILILDFLRRYSHECDAQGMSEAQAYCALEYFLEGIAADHFVAVNNSSTADEGGVNCWPEAVHYLLRSYATHDAIREATLRLTSIKQGSTESEEEYSARLNNAAIRCGNVHPMDEKKTIFIDGLITATKSLVSRFREDNPRATYLELVQHASVEGKTYRARSGVSTPRKQEVAKANTPKQSSNPLLKRTKPALYAERSDTSDDLFRVRRSEPTENLHLLGDTPAFRADPFSDATSELPTTVSSHAGTTRETDPALYVTPRSHPSTPGGNVVRPQRLNFDPHASRNRPGWESPRDFPRPKSPVPVARIICHICYVKNDHIAPDCALPLKEQWQVMRNYTALTAEEQARVPLNSYYRARAQFDQDGKTLPDSYAKSNGGPRLDPRKADERHPAVLQRAKSPNRSGN